jgi:hypothetical protein
MAMIKCPFCQISYVDNTIYCAECGHYLLEDETRETDRLAEEEAGWLGEKIKPEVDSPHHLGSKPLTVRLKIGASKRVVELPLEKVVHIGRVDPNLNIFPEVDVTDDIAPEKSVSRRHARILREGGRVVVEDLGSVNGTFINSKKLDPYLPEALGSGDTLQLGTLLMEVEIIR